jgi:hypothetical protein
MAGPDIAGKTEFVTGKKKFKREKCCLSLSDNLKNRIIKIGIYIEKYHR